MRAAIRLVADTFGLAVEHFVFVGSCVIGLYARPEGGPFRRTSDVDCISTLLPWTLQEKILADLCSSGTLSPDTDLQCRYRIARTEMIVDVMSPDGFNVGGVNPWFRPAAEHSRRYDLGHDRWVRAVTPAYFLATKLTALADRGADAVESRDAEDVVAVAVEVPSLVEEVRAGGLVKDVAELWKKALAKHDLGIEDLPEMVSWHMDGRDREHEERVVRTLTTLATGAPG
jgi:hypothetical protein